MKPVRHSTLETAVVLGSRHWRIVGWLCCAVGLLPAVALGQQPVLEARQPFDVEKGIRQLFLDDHAIAEMKNLKRIMHQPEQRGAVIKPDRSWESALQTRCVPAWDEAEQLFKLWMITSTPTSKTSGSPRRTSRPVWRIPRCNSPFTITLPTTTPTSTTWRSSPMRASTSACPPCFTLRKAKFYSFWMDE